MNDIPSLNPNESKSRNNTRIQLQSTTMLAQVAVTTGAGGTLVYSAPQNSFPHLHLIWASDRTSPGASTLALHMVKPGGTVGTDNRIWAVAPTDEGPLLLTSTLNPGWSLYAVSSTNIVTATLMGVSIGR